MRQICNYYPKIGSVKHLKTGCKVVENAEEVEIFHLKFQKVRN